MENNKTIIIKKQKSEANIVDNDNSSFHLSNMLANIPKNSNQFLRKKELLEYEEEKQNEKSLLYPTLNDPLFSEKIAIQKEFANTKYEGDVKNIKEYAEKMCNAEFELMPHQLFVKNFMSHRIYLCKRTVGAHGALICHDKRYKSLFRVFHNVRGCLVRYSKSLDTLEAARRYRDEVLRVLGVNLVIDGKHFSIQV